MIKSRTRRSRPREQLFARASRQRFEHLRIQRADLLLMRHREDQTADRRSGERDTAARGQAALFQKVADMYLVAVVVLGFHLRGDAA